MHVHAYEIICAQTQTYVPYSYSYSYSYSSSGSVFVFEFECVFGFEVRIRVRGISDSLTQPPPEHPYRKYWYDVSAPTWGEGENMRMLQISLLALAAISASGTAPANRPTTATQAASFDEPLPDCFPGDCKPEQ